MGEGEGEDEHEEDEEGTEDEEAVSGREMKAYAVLTQMAINKLPSGDEALELSVHHLREDWIGQQDHLKTMVAGLLGLEAVHSAIHWWWGYLVNLLKTNSQQPHGSERALAYENARREKRLEKQREFCHEPTIVTEAIKVGVDKRRVSDCLTSFFGAIDEVVDKRLAQELAIAHVIQVASPTHDVFELDIRQRRLVYNLGGWLLGTALARVNMQPSQGSEFLPFVTSHKYGPAAEIREAHPDFVGTEYLVEERNCLHQGKDIIFASAEFYRFVLALEVGYRHAMLNPGLLATYLGDLPAEVKRVVPSAGPVKAAWGKCVSLVEDPLLGEAGGKGCTRQCDELFDFLVMKWHDCRLFAFAEELTSLKEKFENRVEMAPRDELKAGVGLQVSAAEKKGVKKLVVYTQEQRGFQRSLNRDLSLQAWRTLSVADLRDLVEKCGAKCKPSMRKPELQRVLRSFAPRAGKDDDPELAALRPAVVVPDTWRG